MAREVEPPKPAEQPSKAAPQGPRRQMSTQNSHVFNVPKQGRPRPEHHGARGVPSRTPSYDLDNMAIVQTGPPAPSHPAAKQANRPPSAGFVNPNHRVTGNVPNGRSEPSRPAGMQPVTASTATALDDDLFAPINAWSSSQANTSFKPINKGFRPPVQSATYQINAPSGPPVQGRPAAPTQFFTSNPVPFNPYQLPPDSQFIDLTKAQARTRPLEVVDLDDYMDQDAANEKLKSLLEGNLGGEDVDDDEDQPDEVKALAAGMETKLGLEEKAATEAQPASPKKAKPDGDDGTRAGLKVKLLSHQIVGVKWMNQKETGGKTRKGGRPKGGILADDMGLGKTLQTIATIVTNPRPEKDSDEAKRLGIRPVTSPGTLIVVPLPLLQQWDSEIKKFVDPALNFKVHVHYGPKRQTGSSALRKSDIVLTTYETLVSDFGSSKFIEGGKREACFEVDWYRVVLDEAHRIKNPSTKQSKACCALTSHYRWCLTGTPMQNKLEEIQTLIKFLRIEPYNDLRHWKDQVTNPMARGKGGIAMKRVQILLKAILLRRTKDLLREKGELQTVARTVTEVVADFNPVERKIYENLEDRMANTIDRMGSKLNYANALVLLLRLRQACNHIELVKAELGKDKDALMTGNTSPTKGKSNDGVDDLISGLTTLDMDGVGLGASSCQYCGAQINTAEEKKTRVCAGCAKDLDAVSSQNASETAAKKKAKKAKKAGKKPKPAKQEMQSPSKKDRGNRNKLRIFDSDDEEEEDGGEWLVGQDQRASLGLGRAGGTDDEDAEGGGESLGEEDSESDSDDDSVVKRGSRNRVRNVVSSDTEEDESEQEFDDAVNGRFSSSKKNRRRTIPAGLEDSDEDSDKDSDNSDDSGHDSDDSDLHSRRTSSQPTDGGASFVASAKIRELMKILKRESSDHKTIVFSSFVSMLRLIEPYLVESGLRYEHYNGQMKNDERERSLEALRSNPRTKVLLCSLKSGALGLNLTAASRVVIVEPFWNPFVEEQAIDRVHRIGQKHDVVVYKLTVGDTVEQRIVALQEKKRELAKMALESGHKAKGAGGLTMDQVLALFKRGAEHDNQHDGDKDISESRGNLLRRDTDGSGMGESRTSKPRQHGKTGYEAKGPRRADDPVWGRR